MYTVVYRKFATKVADISTNLDWLFHNEKRTVFLHAKFRHAGNQMKRLLLAICASWVLATPSYAEGSPVVVELYTSQGCSACPPADEMMATLSERDDVIALSLHVDYWDYIGWKDEFADPQHAQRQRAYAQVAGRRSIYTPEMIVNGFSDIVGAKPMELAMAIAKHKQQAAQVEISLSLLASNRILIDARTLQPGLGNMDVVMVRYQAARTARITRGENAGHTIEYVNVAQDWQTIGRWDGQTPLALEIDVPGEHPVVVLLQGQDHGPIHAAARMVAVN